MIMIIMNVGLDIILKLWRLTCVITLDGSISILPKKQRNIAKLCQVNKPSHGLSMQYSCVGGRVFKSDFKETKTSYVKMQLRWRLTRHTIKQRNSGKGWFNNYCPTHQNININMWNNSDDKAKMAAILISYL